MQILGCLYLGVFIDNHLTFKTLIENLEISKLCKYLPKETMILLYHTLIKPLLLKATVIIWGSTCGIYKNCLRVLQNSAVRAITGFQCMQHISPAYSKFCILNLDDLYKSEIANFMFKHSNNTLPKPLTSHFIHFTDIH